MKLKIVFVIVAWMVISYLQKTIAPMVTADMAVSQLKDSDLAYMEFKGMQGLFQYFWIAYILPILVFIPEIKKILTPKGDN